MDAIREVAARYLADSHVPGLAYAVTDARRTIAAGQLGVADVGTGAPVGRDTLFEIGSIGKTFAAIVVLQLAAEGRLRLDDPVVRHLPWFHVPRTGGRITLHHLLSHTAGITAGIDGTPEGAFEVHALRRLAPGSAPGRRFHYSNVGYKALGLVVESVDGRSYAESVRMRVLVPLGMDASEPAITAAIRSRLAVGHDTAPDDRVGHAGLPLVQAPWLETATADGSIASTATDMVRFVRLLIAGGMEGVLAPDAFRRMTTPHSSGPAGYGYGLMARDVAGRRWIGHGGGMVGYLAGLQVDVEAGVGAIVLQNGMDGNPNGLARRLVIAATGGAEPIPSAPATPSPHPGRYVRVDGDPTAPAGFEIVDDAPGAHVEVAGRRAALEPFGDGAWLAGDEALDRHLLTQPGEHEAAWLWHGGTRYALDASDPPPLPQPDERLRQFTGHYRAHNPWTTNFRVVLRGDQLWLTFAAAPDGFDDEQPLVARRDGSFRVGDDRLGPERIRFDTIVSGRALRAWLSGWDYYRVSG